MSNSQMSFSDIQTPADLVKKNEEVNTPLAQAMDAMGEVGFTGSMLMVCWLLNNMADWHQDVALDKAEGRRAVASWAFDHGKIEAALSILRTIDIGLNDDNDDESEAETEA